MGVEHFLAGFRSHSSGEAIVWRDNVYSYEWLLEEVTRRRAQLEDKGVDEGSVVSLEADFSPAAVAMLLALWERRTIVVPLTKGVASKSPERCTVAQVEMRIEISGDEQVTIVRTGSRVDHELFGRLRSMGHPGLVLFTSGSTGTSKAVLHDAALLLERYRSPRKAYRILSFLLFDHIGGINTLLHTLANAGSVVTIPDRSPETVCQAIERYNVEVLPTSPTFLTLLLMSEAYTRYDLSSLQLVTYGTEVMPVSTLRRLHSLFSHLRLQQTYGLSEIGILHSHSKAPDSVWVSLGGDGFETRVVDGILEIRARSAMLGYLNAPSPFTSDGWLRTGDVVEVEGGFFRILGRTSEIINVGGEKVYPVEVENVLQSMQGVEEATVHAESNPITGQIVVASVKLTTGESLGNFRMRMRVFCKGKLKSFQIPQKVILADRPSYGERFKKIRCLA